MRRGLGSRECRGKHWSAGTSNSPSVAKRYLTIAVLIVSKSTKTNKLRIANADVSTEIKLPIAIKYAAVDKFSIN
jgi:hypothetical protein